MQRILLWERRNNTVEPFGETVQQVYARISALRNRLDGPVVSPRHDTPGSTLNPACIASSAAMLGGHQNAASKRHARRAGGASSIERHDVAPCNFTPASVHAVDGRSGPGEHRPALHRHIHPHQQRAHRRSRPDFLTHSSAGDLCDSLVIIAPANQLRSGWSLRPSHGRASLRIGKRAHIPALRFAYVICVWVNAVEKLFSSMALHCAWPGMVP